MQLAFMNHFPLFALVLRVKDPWRLPGGLYFEFVEATANKIGPAGGSSRSGPGITSSEAQEGPHLVSSLIPILKVS